MEGVVGKGKKGSGQWEKPTQVAVFAVLKGDENVAVSSRRRVYRIFFIRVDCPEDGMC